MSREEGQEFANKLNIPFLECSARDAINIQELFYTMCQEILNDKGIG